MIDKNDFIVKKCKRKNNKTANQKLYRAYCDKCGCDKKIYRSVTSAGCLCRSCSAKERMIKYPNPMQGKEHINLTKFRPVYSNVDYTDFILKVTTAGKKRRYRMACRECGEDRGYLAHSEARRSCLICHTKKYTKKTKEQKHLYGCIKSNINARFASRQIDKEVGSTRFLPYTIDELFVHLESLFEPWMNWDNHGLYDPNSQLNPNLRTWQIDHIIPDSYFSYEVPSDQGFLDSWALTNLRPLESKQNIYKGAKIG